MTSNGGAPSPIRFIPKPLKVPTDRKMAAKLKFGNGILNPFNIFYKGDTISIVNKVEERIGLIKDLHIKDNIYVLKKLLSDKVAKRIALATVADSEDKKTEMDKLCSAKPEI